MSCYEQFGWTPNECKAVLTHYPMESDLLSVYFEELAAFRGEQYADMKRQQEHNDPDWHTDQVFEDSEDDD